MRYTTEQRGNCSLVRIRYNKAFEQDFLLTADRHHDNPHTLQDLERKHLDEAVARSAGIIDFGDLFCAMQGKYDKRASKRDLRPEHQVEDYLDALVDTAVPFYGPYARHFIRMCWGNHERSIVKRCETDLTRRLVTALNEQYGSSIHHGGYSGWVHFLFESRSGRVDHKKLWYIHGYGGGGPVTRGVIQSNRQAVYAVDADFVVNGHIHESWNLEIPRVRLSDDSVIGRDTQYHIRIPTYKDEYGDGSCGWHVERGGPPKPLGACWLTFRKRAGSDEIAHTLERAR